MLMVKENIPPLFSRSVQAVKLWLAELSVCVSDSLMFVLLGCKSHFLLFALNSGSKRTRSMATGQVGELDYIRVSGKTTIDPSSFRSYT
jgi:hypothetical protein